MSVDDEVNDLESQLKELRVAYEKFFLGIDRIEPLKLRDRVQRSLLRFQARRVNNTALRFRLQTLQASFVTHSQYWNRVTRQIEEGTFRRDKHKLNKGVAQASGTTAESAAPSHSANNGKSPQHVAYPAAIQSLYQSFTTVQKQVGDSRAISLDQLARTVQGQYKAIKERYGCRTVDFRVAVKDGRATLKAVPKS